MIARIGIGVSVFAALIYGVLHYQHRQADLLEREGWLRFSGATATARGIHFNPLGRVIVHNDGSAGQPNPPVNVLGGHLRVEGDFRISIILMDIDAWASFRLYATPPLVYDAWRYESPSIDMRIAHDFVTVRIWDGSSSDSMDMRTYAISSTPRMTLSLEHKNGHIAIILNNRLLGSLPDHDIFRNGSVWFGADSAPESAGFTLASLTAQGLGMGRVELIPPPSLAVDTHETGTLRTLADTTPRKIQIGAAVALVPLLTDERYRAVALGEFSMLTPENSMKPQFIHPQESIYTFEEADGVVSAALQNGLAVHGHALVYDKSTPDWMRDAPKQERRKIMLDHIHDVVNHFKGKVAEWDVVNEPFSKKWALYKDGGDGLESNIWFEAMGERYIDLAFKAAHAADPSAKLYLNDNRLERDGERWDALLGLLKRLKMRGVPIDGVGFEAHVYGDGDYIDAGQLRQHMKILAELGLSARISEIDVTGDDSKEQINQYVIALDACLRAPNCTSYTTWGITDLYGSTTRSDRYPLVYGTSLLWDKDMKEKPAYTALRKRLTD